jgi:hypothetical protein
MTATSLVCGVCDVVEVVTLECPSDFEGGVWVAEADVGEGLETGDSVA